MMRQELIIPAQDVKIWLGVDGLIVAADTATSLSRAFVQQVDNIHAIGSADPIGIVYGTKNYTIDMTLQSGEYQAILNAVNAQLPAGRELYATWLQFRQITVTWVHNMVNLAVPQSISTSMLDAKISNDSEDITRESMETNTTINFTGVGLKRTVTPLVLV